MNWDDLQVAAMVHQYGTYARAAQQLNMDETTVARRLTRLQKDLGITLFEAVDGQRRPTTACLEILNHVGDMYRHACRIAALADQEPGLSGRFRIATTAPIAENMLAPFLADFLLGHPGITIEWLIATGNVNFDRWEADFAIRLGRPERGNFLIRKLADLPLVLVRPSSIPLEQARVCAYPPELDFTPESQLLTRLGLKSKAQIVSTHAKILVTLLKSGQFTAVLPSFLAKTLHGNAGLLFEPLPEMRELWLLTQPHLHDNSAALAVGEWIRSCLPSRLE